MAQVHGTKSSASEAFTSKGGQTRREILNKTGGTGDFGARYKEYEELVKFLSQPSTQNPDSLMARRMALVQMNQPLGGNYFRRIEPAMSYQYENADEASMAFTKVLMSNEPTYMLINIRFQNGAAHTVAAFGKKNTVSLFDPNQGEDYSSNFSVKNLDKWLESIRTTLKADAIKRISCVTMTAIKKN